MYSKRKMLIFTRLENSITIQVIGKKNEYRNSIRSNNYYITKASVQLLLDNNYLVSRDIYSFLEAGVTKSNTLLLSFTWLDSNGHTLKGFLEQLEINFNDFVKWFESDSESYRALEILNSKTSKIKFINTENLIKALGNSLIKNKLLKILMRFQNNWGNEVRIYNDYIPYSFYFEEYVNGKRGICGGIIYHVGNGKIEDGYYSIHT